MPWLAIASIRSVRYAGCQSLTTAVPRAYDAVGTGVLAYTLGSVGAVAGSFIKMGFFGNQTVTSSGVVPTARPVAKSAGTPNRGATAQNDFAPVTEKLERLAERIREAPDERLAEVTARYNRKTGKLTVTDDDTGKRVVVDVESGHKPTGDPIPKEEWEILEQARTGQYRLDALDRATEKRCS